MTQESKTSQEAPQGDLPPNPHLPPSPSGLTSTQSDTERPRTIWVVWDEGEYPTPAAVGFFSSPKKAQAFMLKYAEKMKGYGVQPVSTPVVLDEC